MHSRLVYFFCVVFFFFTTSGYTQRTDEQIIKALFEESLTKGKSYYWLEYLCDRIGSRLTGSVSLKLAERYTKAILDTLHPNDSYLQAIETPAWMRGTLEFAYFETRFNKRTNVAICAMGGSVPTSAKGLKGKLIKIKTIEALSKIAPDKIKGKIVFLNQKMILSNLNLRGEYQRIEKIYKDSAVEAVKYGASGVILRSLTTDSNNTPYTGMVSYGTLPKHKRIPVAAISPNDANLLESMLVLNPDIKFYFFQSSKTQVKGTSHNVIAEFRGSQFPNEIITIGAHLDSWDLGEGAHDSASGCVQAIEVIRLMKRVGYKPKRTIRIVLFTGKEYNYQGVRVYREKTKQEKIIFAIENDSGGFSPSEISFNCNDATFQKIRKWESLLQKYNLFRFSQKDIQAGVHLLAARRCVTAEVLTMNQKYYDYIHSKEDKLSTVNKRELQIGSAIMSSIVYLIDKYGL